MRRFTRLTNAFSKKVENHAAQVSLHFMHYNFARPHQSLGKKTRPRRWRQAWRITSGPARRSRRCWTDRYHRKRRVPRAIRAAGEFARGIRTTTVRVGSSSIDRGTGYASASTRQSRTVGQRQTSLRQALVILDDAPGFTDSSSSLTPSISRARRFLHSPERHGSCCSAVISRHQLGVEAGRIFGDAFERTVPGGGRDPFGGRDLTMGGGRCRVSQ